MGRRQSHLLLLTLLLAAAAAAGTGWARTLTAAGTPHEDELFELVVQRLRLHTRQPMTAFGKRDLHTCIHRLFASLDVLTINLVNHCAHIQPLAIADCIGTKMPPCKDHR